MEKLTIVMTGGGTGGHVIPNLALIPDLKKNFNIYYLGQKKSIEEQLISRDKDITFIPISAVKLVRKLTPKNLLIPYKLYKSLSSTKKILKNIKPDVIFAKGGFVSLPVALSGAKLNIPILAHESDFSMGLANKIILKKSKVMFTSFRETCISNKCIYSGSPVRKEIFSANKDIAEKYCHFSQPKPTILFFGGSQGSKSINKFVIENLSFFENYNIIHFVGKNNTFAINSPNYCQIEFAENIYDYFAMSDIVVCRAGANSIFELLAMQKLMVLVPLPLTQSRGDQIENAKSFKKSGFAEILEEQDLTVKNLLAKINNLQKNKFYFLSNMKNFKGLSANQMICKYILDYASKTIT